MGLSREQAIGRLVVALDTSTRQDILDLAGRLRSSVGMFKIGLEAFSACGPSLVEDVNRLGMSVFLDLKLHDIPNTVEKAAANCARLGVKLITVHASGGQAMLKAAMTGVAAGAPAPNNRPQVLAVTVLTSIDQPTLASLGIPGSPAERVMEWAYVAQKAGCDGVVCSPQEVGELRRRVGPDFILLAPGIRPAGEAIGDQKRVATPHDAIAAGASYLVVGRPITAAGDPLAAAEAIVAEMMT